MPPNATAQQSRSTQKGAPLRQTLISGGVLGTSQSGSGSSASNTFKGAAGRAAFVTQQPRASPTMVQDLHHGIAMAFYSCNIPFNMIEAADFKAMLTMLNPSLQGRLPSRKVLATTLLDAAYNKEKQRVQQWLSQQQCVSITTDGWSTGHVSSSHVLNVNAVANGTSVFLDLVFTGTHSHTGAFIADSVLDVLKDWGVEGKTVAFITDWGSNMVSAGNILQTKLSACLTPVHCIMHLLNNALKDFCKHPGLNNVLDTVNRVVKYFNSKDFLRSLYDVHKGLLKGTALIKPAATRFGSNVGVLRAVEHNK